MSFKDVIASDVHDTFMNADEFSDMHDLNGKMIPVQVDSNEQIEREKRFNQHMDGIYKNQKLIYVAATDYGPMHLLLSKKKSNDRPCPITMQTRLPFSSFALICVLLWTCRTVLRLNRAELMLKKSKFPIFSRWQRP